MRAGKTRRLGKESLIQSEIPYQINRISEGARMNYSKITT